MKKIKISKRIAKILDCGFWLICIGFAYSVDWKVFVAFIAFDIMRAFEDGH